MSFLKSENKSGFYCPYPFTFIRNNPKTGYKPCCWMNVHKPNGKRTIYEPSKQLPFEYFYGDFLSEVRRDMLSGERTELLEQVCSKCIKREEETGTSPRLMREYETGINLELNIYSMNCNLECVGCRPEDSSTRNKRVKQLLEVNSDYYDLLELDDNILETDFKKVDPFRFYEILADIEKHSDQINSITFCGGEPALMKGHFELLDRLISNGCSKKINLAYVSNFTCMKRDKMQKYIDNFKFVSFQWSMDGVAEVNNYLRYPTDWHSTVKNVFDFDNVSATFTPTSLALLSIKETFDWLERHGLKPDDVYNRVLTPEFLQPRHLPQHIKKIINNDVKEVSVSLHRDMWREGDPKMHQILLNYLDDLDRLRGTNWKQIFPLLT